MEDVDPESLQQINHITEREREPNVKHHRQADDLRACFKVTKRRRFATHKRYETTLLGSSQFPLTVPGFGLKRMIR
jgi:hypothetical protein